MRCHLEKSSERPLFPLSLRALYYLLKLISKRVYAGDDSICSYCPPRCADEGGAYLRGRRTSAGLEQSEHSGSSYRSSVGLGKGVFWGRTAYALADFLCTSIKFAM